MAQKVYTPKRAQNEISPENVETLLEYYKNYEDVIERCKVVSLHDIEEKGFDLDVNRYIEKRKVQMISPEEARKSYYEALSASREVEQEMNRLLIEGGYIHE